MRIRENAVSINGTSDISDTYDVDAIGRITNIVQTSQAGGNPVAYKRVKLHYAPDSQLDNVTRYSSASDSDLVATSDSTNMFDGLGRLTALTHSTATLILDQYAWNFDAGDRLTKETSQSDGVRTYTNDAADELSTVQTPNPANNESYTYDYNSNRKSANGNVYGTPNPGNRLSSDGVYTYSYDDEGNRTGRTKIGTSDITTYMWDYRNRLQRETRSGNPHPKRSHFLVENGATPLFKYIPWPGV